MEGLLWKWTNYWSGWQPRWFILDDGILSYYNSRDEVASGSKGSIKMSVCDVVVNTNDATRLDLTIPGEQYYFLKAANSKERQQWLIAIGSCKASLQTMSNPIGYKSTTDQNRLTAGIKQKKSELKVYCDLLMQQVHTIKEAAHEEPINMERLDESSALLAQTCDTFIHALESCVNEVEKNSNTSEISRRTISANQPSSPVNPGLKHLTKRSNSIEDRPRSILKPKADNSRSRSQSSTDGTDTDTSIKSNTSNRVPNTEINSNHIMLDNGSTSSTNSSPNHKPPNNLPLTQESTSQEADADEFHEATTPETLNDEKGDQHRRPKIMHFLNTLGSSFLNLDIRGGVPCKDFLLCSKDLGSIFDKLSATAFAPVKSDFMGNIKKIEQKWCMDPRSFPTLEKIIAYEVENKQHTDPNSATQALLWLCRGLLFVCGILDEMLVCSELHQAVSSSYERTLKPFHNFVVRGVVSIAMRASPYKATFVRSLAQNPEEAENTDDYLRLVHSDITQFCNSVKLVGRQLSDFYLQHNMVLLQHPI